MARPKKPKKPKRDEARENRITMEIVVDAYDESERAAGWYCYLEEKLNFPFPARCIKERAISPLGTGDEVEVVGMAPEDECMREMFVEISWAKKRTLAVPLSQLEVVHGDDETRQAVEDWHYWVATGYEC
ncbi:Calcium binding protein [Aquisphaera giovannonii]|uniref:Calcium binding protein n=1 Tax=Aquisphaera giovannonii TaxID=406548 RepID=A0A5B9VVA7_9BACT|nr:calcium-binding protein [Aquisphaera giovannonii]QEH31867.1 Calcium binding protein [Aquisphaera giovannonii]